MRRGWFAFCAVAVLLLALGWGVSGLYGLRVARGDVFPEYSSLRADPLGLRALHDAAALLPGRSVVRWTRPLDRLEAGEGDVVFVSGVDRRRRGGLRDEDWDEIDRLAVAGARVVVAWRAEAASDGDAEIVREVRAAPWSDKPEKTQGKADKRRIEEEADPDEDEQPEREPIAAPAGRAGDAERRLGFRLMRRDLVVGVGQADAIRAESAPAGWPEAMPSWRSDLFFLPREDAGWRVQLRRAGEPVMMERARGRGAIALLADSFAMSNEAVWRERATPMLASLLGGDGRVIFVESHLGVLTEPGVASLARRYGLAGAALASLALAGLWIWRHASPLAPLPPEERELRLRLAPTAGLEALLRRAVTPAKLHATCLDAWRASATPGDLRRIQSAPAVSADDPVSAYNATSRALSHRKLS